MSKSNFDKVLDALPYSDGSARRRFIAGGLLVFGLAIMDLMRSDSILGGFEGFSLLNSPVFAAGLVVLIYALGNVVEMLGEMFFVRAASGFYWGLSMPYRWTRAAEGVAMKTLNLVFGLVLAPFAAYVFLIEGMFGRARYKFDLISELSEEAQKKLDVFPEKVASGLFQPIGNDAEFAQKFLIDSLQSEHNRKWAKSQLFRSKDVSATTTSLLIVAVAYLALQSGFGGSTFGEPTEGDLAALREAEETEQIVRNEIFSVLTWNVETSDLVYVQKSEIITLYTRSLREAYRDFSSDYQPLGVAALTGFTFIQGRRGFNRGLFEYLVSRGIEEVEAAAQTRFESPSPRGSIAGPKSIESDLNELRRIQEQLDPALMKFYSAASSHNRAWTVVSDKRENAAALRSLISLLLSLLLFLLYIGYFVSLRSATLSIVECAALQEAPTPDDAPAVPKTVVG